MGTDRVGIVGAGVMGAEIAGAAAAAGLDVTLQDVSSDALETARKRIAKILERLDTGPSAALELTSDDGGLSDRDLVIEAVPENLELKAEVFRRLDDVVTEDAILASNTSGLSITTLARETRRPARVLGLHFFNPASRMQLVEIVRGDDTTADVMARATVIVERLGKTPVRVRECPGFLVNRILVRAITEAYRAHGDPHATDAAVISGGPAPMGPYALGDLIGLDTLGAIQQDLERAYGERFADGGVIGEHVTRGRLGRKSGAGFFDYSADAAVPDITGARSGASAYYLGALHEAALCVGDDVAGIPEVDLALELGAGWSQGPLAWADSQGLASLLEQMQERVTLGNERFAPPAELATRAASGERFRRE
jgi:enoyl-CoA hydratase/3-hydroxyacyl-CoA dehydrogenase